MNLTVCHEKITGKARHKMTLMYKGNSNFTLKIMKNLEVIGRFKELLHALHIGLQGATNLSTLNSTIPLN